MKLNKLWYGSIDNIGWAAVIVGFSSFISRFLGVFRDHILAGQFGAGDELDIYYAAFRVPDLIFNLLVLGALSAGFIPIFVNLLDKSEGQAGDNQAAWRFTNIVINFLLIILILLSIIGIVLAPQIIKAITPGFSAEKLSKTVELGRLMFLSPLLLGLSGIVGGVLQSFKRFFAYSLSPIFYNLGIIVGALFLVPRVGLIGLAWGVVIGALLHLLVQVPTLRHLGFRYRFILDWRDKYLRQIGRIMVPRTLGLAVSQLNLLAMAVLASKLASGSLAVFNLANNLQSFPVGIFGLSFAVAAFPTMSALVSEPEKLKVSLAATIRQTLFLVIPSTVIILGLRAQIIRVILGSGRFDWQDTILTMRTLSYFGISIFAQSLNAILVRVFYAYKDSATPFWISLVSVMVNISLAWLLSEQLGVAGLALAFSVGSIVNFILLWIFLRAKAPVLDIRVIGSGALKMIIAAAISGLALMETKKIIAPLVNMRTFWGIFGQLCGAAAVAAIVYVAICSLLRCPETKELWMMISRRWSGKKKKIIIDAEEARGV
ncbi:MAG TPA: murein biosynthesis integral membrane protein MurJ [bacterium]|jgi:putative peptidoglycan lipid II flippase|nr:MAG: putative peptidoglycan biosynthesis protein MurJ [Parcubacteria group bacterium ADurb.Bin016]HNQ44742.1 murein biosynthesis integral membrane protein MurJ [bacterium]HRS73194.1 murein biosynthesis integral membrane protein MurJ [Patescibacteria group bacterium]HNU89876.1 murein biosynthesis integral membrane protein MurJ [bacterium]HOE81073.1 murein biosynthesis integral membrane protein MurJ [bacterium]